MAKNGNKFLYSLRVGFFLAIRNIRRANIWTTALIIFVMTLTFLNLVAVSGILVGSIEGSSRGFRAQYSGDVIVSNFVNRKFIEQTPGIIRELKSLEGVVAVSSRFLSGARIEANFRSAKSQKELTNQASTILAGINPKDEISATELSKFVVEGSFLAEGDEGFVVLGSELLKKYSPFTSPGYQTLENVKLGDRVRISFDGIQKEFVFRGVIKTKAGETDRRAYILASEFIKLSQRYDFSANEIVVKLSGATSPELVKQILEKSGAGKRAVVQTWNEAQGKFFKDLAATLGMIGNILSSIGLAVACITIFIVIYINAISRRKYIGILKGIGISGQSLRISYIFQSLFYSFAGALAGILITYAVLLPYFAKNPIDFPFGDGILVAPIASTLLRLLILIIVTIVAGYIPATLVVKKNTLDSILGRL